MTYLKHAPRHRRPRLTYSYRFLILAVDLCLACSCVGAIDSFAQVTDQKDDEVVRVSTNLLLFPIRVRDKRGSIVNNLTVNDLALNDVDKVVRGLEFLQGLDRVVLVFALDESGSLRDMISAQKDAALTLFDRFGNKSSVAVLRFAEIPTVAAPFARDTSNARAAFDVSVRRNQHTAIFDAALKATEMFDTLSRVRYERRIVILISDGLDNASKVKPKMAIDFAKDKRVSFYVIHLPLFEPRDGRLAVRRPTKGFQELAEQTGGKYFLIDEPSLGTPKHVDLTKVFHAIEEDLKSQYLLGFYLNEKANDDRRHSFDLSLPAGLEYQVGSRSYSRTHKFLVAGPR